MRELSHRCVLVVDDDSVVRDIVSQTVRAMGFEVLTAENGLKALEALKNVRVDAIVCDIEMPEMNGIEFFKTLKSQNVDTPVIIVTGLTDRERILDALRLGALDFVQKPFRPDDLKPIIQRAVEIGVRRNRLHFSYREGDHAHGFHQEKMIGLLTLKNHKKRSAS